MSTLRSEYGHLTIQQLVHHFEHGQLNLEPGFQRNSVWTLKERQSLIESLFMSYPVPSIFLYKNHDAHGGLMYDVNDGKPTRRINLHVYWIGPLSSWPVRRASPIPDSRQRTSLVQLGATLQKRCGIPFLRLPYPDGRDLRRAIRHHRCLRPYQLDGQKALISRKASRRILQ